MAKTTRRPHAIPARRSILKKNKNQQASARMRGKLERVGPTGRRNARERNR